MRFFTSKKSFISSGLLTGATDIHSHILPGVDDGINNYADAVETLQWLKSDGVGRIFLTPHIMSDFSKNTSFFLTERFDIFMKTMKNEGVTDIPEVKLCAEYMLEADFVKQKKGGLLTFADRHVLVETSYMTPPLGFVIILENLLEHDYSPILAHPERYHYMDMKDYTMLKNQGIKLQLNFIALTGAYGSFIREKAERLLMEGYYNFTGSDIHHLTRHKDAYNIRKLTEKQILKLQPLFLNNQSLW